MIRILFFLAFVFLLGLGFAWLADRPGDLVMTVGGYQYRVSLMVAAVAVTAVVAAAMILWWLLKAIWRSPYMIARYFRVRRRDRGYQALSTGMIAAGAGDATLARTKNKEAQKLIRSDQEPLIHLLDAQASLLEGDHEAAREKFDAMLDDPETRLLGLRGLYLEAERLGDREASRHYAARAAEIAPHLPWAAHATIEERAADGDWDGALKLLDAQKPSRQGEREALARRRAVLLTAKAISTMETDQTGARNAALEANRLLPGFAPAAVAAAQALIRQGDVRKASKILEAAWKAEPHPEIADVYVHARHGDAVLDRLTRARRLQSLKQNHPESALAVARAALDAGDYAEARKAAESAIRMQPREGAYLLLADIEEAETGDQGRARQWLAKAIRAPLDPAWVADGFVSDRWAPISPVTGRLDAFEWRAPMERLGQTIEQEDERLAIEPPHSAVAEVEAAAEGIPAKPISEPVIEVPAAPAAAAPAAEPATETPGEAAERPGMPSPAEERATPAATNGDATAEGPAEPTKVKAADGSEKAAHTVDEPETIMRLPDDPGVDPNEAGEAQRRFRLF